MKFNSSNHKYEFLRKKWINKHTVLAAKVDAHRGDVVRKMALGGLGGLMLVTTPGVPLHIAKADNEQEIYIESKEDKTLVLRDNLSSLVPSEVRKLTTAEEDKITQELSDKFGFPVKPEIDGIRLNKSYALIGGEQHLYRYPGDNLFLHADNMTDWYMYGASGIAPALGAWGYFASSKAQFTEEDKQRERYYIAVQTFLAPGFSENVVKYRDFFKFRKMLVVNPKTGQAVVTDIGDAGPAEYTGKSLGGSPEVMQGLGLATGPRKGAVLYFFIDDPEDKIPLGPVQINK